MMTDRLAELNRRKVVYHKTDRGDLVREPLPDHLKAVWPVGQIVVEKRFPFSNPRKVVQVIKPLNIEFE